MSKAYEKAGVSLENSYEAIKRIKQHAKRTNNLGAMAEIGDFGGFFHLQPYQYKDPILVSGTDGVGTKLLIAQEANIHTTIGIDLVAMCVNDIAAVGAKPLFFLDYIAIGKVEPSIIEDLVKGMSDACREVGCSLLGGETAEMPDLYKENHYDLAGFAVGAVEREQLLAKNTIKEGDVLIGLPSSGLHSNGYSLVRKILFKDNPLTLWDYQDALECRLVDELLKPTKLYVLGFEQLFTDKKIKSMAHITGGGFIENIPRALPDGLGVVIEENTLPQMPIFSLLLELSKLSKLEMYNVFNMGIGMVAIVSKENVQEVCNHLMNFSYEPRVIGSVVNNVGVTIR